MCKWKILPDFDILEGSIFLVWFIHILQIFSFQIESKLRESLNFCTFLLKKQQRNNSRLFYVGLTYLVDDSK